MTTPTVTVLVELDVDDLAVIDEMIDHNPALSRVAERSRERARHGIVNAWVTAQILEHRLGARDGAA